MPREERDPVEGRGADHHQEDQLATPMASGNAERVYDLARP
jgi:hypothetical protein